jgi:hypothetical protein
VAIFASVLFVAGATSMRSARSVSLMCCVSPGIGQLEDVGA